MNSNRIPPREAFLFTVIIAAATALAITNKDTVKDYYMLLGIIAGAISGYLTSDAVQTQLMRDLRERKRNELSSESEDLSYKSEK